MNKIMLILLPLITVSCISERWRITDEQYRSEAINRVLMLDKIPKNSEGNR